MKKLFTEQEARKVKKYNKFAFLSIVPVWENINGHSTIAGYRVFECTPEWKNMLEHIPNNGNVGDICAKSPFDVDGTMSGRLHDAICRGLIPDYNVSNRYCVEFVDYTQYTRRNGSFAIYDREDYRVCWASYSTSYWDFKEALKQCERYNDSYVRETCTLKIIETSREETNPFADPEKANNGGGYSQPSLTFKFSDGVVINIDDTSCGDFGSRIDAMIQEGTNTWCAHWGTMENEDFRSEIPEDKFRMHIMLIRTKWAYNIPTKEEVDARERDFEVWSIWE